jgi:type II secretory pathway component PulC
MIWTILGISVAIVAAFCVTMAETLVGKPIFENNRFYIAAALASAGVVASIVGIHLGRKRKAEAQQENTENNTDEESDESSSKQFLLSDLRYWGPMLLALGIITVFIRPFRTTKEEPKYAEAPKPKPPAVVVTNPPPAPEPKGPVVFPDLKMQGVFFREDRPFAIINGQSYAVGDHVGSVRIKAIDRAKVVVELSGEYRLLTLN